ncbi:MAG: VOC family protein [Ilumatobacteraceae bacterium]
MITSMHALIYSDDVDATRTFLRDVVGFPFVNDSGTSDGSATGWLIFGTGPSELGVHPTRSEWDGQVWESARHVEISFMCDDVVATRAELEAKGAIFDGDIVDQGYGLVTSMQVPGADAISLYEPRHAVAYPLDRS